MHTMIKFLGVATALGALSACSGSGSDNDNRRNSGGSALSSRQFIVNESLGTVSFNGGNSLNLTLSPGSGAFHAPSADRAEFYTVTDRGPTIDCSETDEVLGVASFCSGNGAVFALPDYAPQILRWKLNGSGGDLSLALEEKIPLKDGFGTPLPGLPNDLRQTTTEQAYGPSGNVLMPDANGVDPEAIVRLENGRFWLAEEYGPSLLLVESDGEVVQRQVPAGLASDLGFSTLDVREDILPGILSRRQLHRGIEALAVSPDEKFLYFIMQSPLANPDEEAYTTSRVVRIGKVSLATDGTPQALVGEYLYRLDSPRQYGFKFNDSGDLPGGEYVSQSSITVNAAVAAGVDDLLVVEQAESATKVYRINLADAVDIKGGEFDSLATSPSLEELQAVEDAPFVVKHLVFDSISAPLPAGISTLGSQVEGLALLDANFAAVTSDNQYGIRDETAKITVLPITSLLSGRSSPVAPSLDYADSVLIQRMDASFDAGTADAVVADSASAQLFIANNQQTVVDVINVATPLTPSAAGELDVSLAAGDVGVTPGQITSLAVGGGYLAVTISSDSPEQNGALALYDLATLDLEDTFLVGPSPKSVVFNRAETRIFVANEGVPSADYSVDPEGSITAINIASGLASAALTTIDFQAFNAGGSRADELPDEVLITGPNATVAQDLEPEQMAVDLDDAVLYVGLQENNAIAKVDIASNTVDDILALGSKDFGTAAGGLDSNNDGDVEILSRPGVVGLFQPAGVAAYKFDNKNFFVTANEGAPRSYAGFNEVVPAADLDGFNGPDIDSSNASIAAASNTSELGNLRVSSVTGDTDGDGDIDEISAFGARSLTIWNEEGEQVFDTGDDIAQITQAYLGNNFNDRDTASISRGAEPKAISLVGSANRVYALVTLEASGGVIIYDVTSPYGVQFIEYINNRSFSFDPEADSGDLGPVSLSVFSVSGAPYLAVAHRRSGLVRVLKIDTGI